MLPYLIHASLLLSGCFIFYWLLISKETFFRLNRWVLISSILLSLTVPLIPVPEGISLRSMGTSEEAATVSPATYEAPVSAIVRPVNNEENIPQEAEEPNSITEQESESIDPSEVTLSTQPADEMQSATKTWYSELAWGSLLWYGYLMGVIVFTLAFFVQLFIVVARIISLESIRDGRFKIIELVKDEAPYSFWNTIFVNPAKYDPGTYQQIIDHEKIHIQQAHFIDKLIAEFLVIVFWFNPFAWLFRRAITNNLEYLTDSSMLEIGTEKQTYQLSLLKVSVPQYPLHLTTNYNSSFLKSRIAMMNTKKSSARSTWKYLFLFPLVLFSMLCLNEVQSKKAELLAELQETESLQEQASPSDKTTPETVTQDKDKDKEKEKEKDKDKDKNKDRAKSTSITMSSGQSKMSFNNTIMNGNLRPGEWEGEIDGDKVCLQLNTSRPALGYRSTNTACFKKSAFSEIPMEKDKDFYIKREAGKLLLNGSFSGKVGEGTFEYEPDANFTAYLSKEGMDVPEEKQLHLFMADINKSYIGYLRSEGFKLSGHDLVQLAIHRVDRERSESYVQLFKDLDHKGYQVRDLITFDIHGVDAAYVNEIRALGMTDLAVQDIVQAKIHDVEPAFIASVKAYGFKDVGLQDIIQFSIHDVDVAYIDKLKSMGYRDLSHRDIVQASIHDVNPDYIKEMSEAGLKDISMQGLIQFSIHDIDADYIKSFKSAGLNINERDIIQASIHDIDVDAIKAMQALGLKDLDMETIIQLAIRDVDADYLRKMKAVGYKKMSPQDLVQARMHDIDPSYIKELKAAGLEDMDFQEVVQFAIHNVQVDEIKDFKTAGFDANAREIIQASIHDVDVNYIKEMRATGFEDADFEDFIQAKIHGVNPSFIKRARENGYNPKTLREYVRLKASGI
jgi:hypothetical protein